jgi:8-oxo-dGTP diphosphatase
LHRVKSNRPYLAVRAIITDESGNVLILKRAGNSCKSGEWCLPGGCIDYGQTAVEALAREIKEETSLTCHEVKFLFYLDNLPQQNLTSHFVTLFFLCDARGTLKLNYESSEYAWIGLGDIEKYKIAFGNNKALKNYWRNENRLIK